MENKRKIILVDMGHFVHKSIYSKNAMLKRKQEFIDNGESEKAEKIFVMSPTYNAMAMLIGQLKKIGVNPDAEDRVILAYDGRHSWRKDIIGEYKGNRDEIRSKASFVNWDEEYKEHNKLMNRLEEGTPFFIIQIPTLEADDIIASAVQFYKDEECIILSEDHDFDQLLTRDNVKIFSPNSKVKNYPYRILDINRDIEKKKAYKSLMKKIRKESADNLMTEVSNEQEYDKRELVVKLIDLPKFVTEKVFKVLQQIETINKDEYDLSVFALSIRKRLMDIYKEDKIIAYEQCMAKLLKKKDKKKKIKK